MQLQLQLWLTAVDPKASQVQNDCLSRLEEGPISPREKNKRELMWPAVLLLLAGPTRAEAGKSPLPASPPAGQPPTVETVSMLSKTSCEPAPRLLTDKACPLNCNIPDKQNHTGEKIYSPLTGSYMQSHHDPHFHITTKR